MFIRIYYVLRRMFSLQTNADINELEKFCFLRESTGSFEFLWLKHLDFPVPNALDTM